MSNVVETLVNSDFFETPPKCNNNAQAQEQEVKDCTQFLRIECQKYRQYKIILDGIEECIEDENNLDENLRKKIKNVILETSTSQTRLSDKSNEETSDTVLGLSLGNTEITHSESSKLLSCLKSKLNKKCLKLKNGCLLLGIDINEFELKKNESPLDLTQEDAILLEFRNKLALEQECFIKNQIELLEILEELKSIRLRSVPEVTDQKVHECNLRSKINYLKSQLAKEKCRLDIFMESTNSLKAYTEIIKDIKEQQSELKIEIDQLKDLKKKYAQVSCKEYDDILKSFLQYKSSLEKKKMIYELCG